MSSKRYLEASKVEAIKQMMGIRVAEPALLRRVFQQNPAVADLAPHVKRLLAA
ncbi:MAG: hypothetical protein ABIK08_11110 [Pseudomonadota bacterium]